MRKIFTFCLAFIFQFTFSQKMSNEKKLMEKYEASQPQDFSVPPPPKITFPAQFPEGNNTFIKKVKLNIAKDKLMGLPKTLNTKIILKIDTEGNVLNISTYGKNEIFNNEVKLAVSKTTAGKKWEAGQNSAGEKVIDIVQLPLQLKN